MVVASAAPAAAAITTSCPFVCRPAEFSSTELDAYIYLYFTHPDGNKWTLTATLVDGTADFFLPEPTQIAGSRFQRIPVLLHRTSRGALQTQVGVRFMLVSEDGRTRCSGYSPVFFRCGWPRPDQG